MGWRDGSNFKRWMLDNFPHLVEATDEKSLEMVEHLRQAYEQGYSDGFCKGQSYDRFWDSD